MLNAATLSAVGDYVSLAGGKNFAPAYVAESPMLNSSKSGSNAAPGASSFKWPPVGPVGG